VACVLWANSTLHNSHKPCRPICHVSYQEHTVNCGQTLMLTSTRLQPSPMRLLMSLPFTTNSAHYARCLIPALQCRHYLLRQTLLAKTDDNVCLIFGLHQPNVSNTADIVLMWTLSYSNLIRFYSKRDKSSPLDFTQDAMLPHNIAIVL